MDPLEKLRDRTYALQHNPNCPEPYLIRLPGRGVIDYKPISETSDQLFYGTTLMQAVARAMVGIPQ